MANKRKRKAKKQAFRIVVFGSVCLIIVGAILTTITTVWIEIFAKYKEKEELEDKILALKQQEEELSIDVERLQDPEYVARYLREKYFYSKNGEYIIRIPEQSKN